MLTLAHMAQRMEETANVCLFVWNNIWNMVFFLSPLQSLGFAKFHTDVGTDFPYALFFFTTGRKTPFSCKKIQYGNQGTKS